MSGKGLIATLWRHMVPAMGATSGREVARATLGTALAISLTDLLLWSLRHLAPALPGGSGDPMRELILVSPFAATAFLILTVPNSPLAQPWSVIVGNTIAAACGVLCVWLFPVPFLSAALAVGLSVIAMAAARALHPPGAAMALNAVLLHFSGAEVGPTFVLATVTLGSVLLVIFGLAFNPLTGRRYPFRQADEALPSEAGTLAMVLERLRLSANIGVADLSRLIAAVEVEATARHLGHMTAGSMMTRNPFSLSPDADLETMTAAFQSHPFRSIPVVDEGRLLGLLFQGRLIGAEPDVTAGALSEPVPSVSTSAELPEVLPHLTEGDLRVLPVCDGERLVGIITRSDLIGILVRALRGA